MPGAIPIRLLAFLAFVIHETPISAVVACSAGGTIGSGGVRFYPTYHLALTDVAARADWAVYDNHLPLIGDLRKIRLVQKPDAAFRGGAFGPG